MSEDDGPEYDIDFRANPGEYEIGRGEQDVFKCEPYKSELLPLWSIKTLDSAEDGAAEIYEKFQEYRDADEFPGMDLARKYLQMGWTRAMRYAKYPGGQKYEDGEKRKAQEWYDDEKREIAVVYKQHLDRLRDDGTYQRRRQEWDKQ
jgi:hypothetical protein